MQVRTICDDFTSATDGLGAFAALGWPASVALGMDALRTESGANQVQSADTNSRHADATQAAQRVAAWAHAWRDAEVLVKQLDSTLRGPWVAETLAAWRASGRGKLLLAPAFPAAGRTTVQGCVRVDGHLVHETAFAHDPLSPVRRSSLPELFADAGRPLTVARDAAHAVTLLEASDAVVVDASTEEDLQRLVAACLPRRDLMWAGSTGLLRAMANTLPAPGGHRTTRRRAMRAAVVVGSVHPRSRSQRDIAASRGLLVFTTPDQRGTPSECTQALVEQVRTAVMAGKVDGLVVTGGETAAQIARGLGVQAIEVLGEVEPGIALCSLHWAGGELPLVTKAGGFGSDDVFARCIEALEAGGPP